jgi:hypothetical protein
LEGVVDELKKSIARKKEKLCAERLDNGSSTSYTHNGQLGSRSISITGGDGLAAFTSSHTREDGGRIGAALGYILFLLNPISLHSSLI